MKENTPYGFIPHQLEIPGRPELNAFPFNILFAQYRLEQDQPVYAVALYEPGLQSFTIREGSIEKIKQPCGAAALSTLHGTGFLVFGLIYRFIISVHLKHT
ncbi:hypothetical protein KJ910_00350 [Patescibacteria group bacterium]|nr:hypothetical protein [Patescibacteria group bacterium]MBU1906634.1 hypothetical protein [Patescibacteria group bacterium]